MPTQESSRPPLDGAALAEQFDGTRWSVELLPDSPSTNAAAAERARAGADEGLVVLADHQTAGRGRLDRTWVTPARAALTFSALLSPDDVPVARWPWLPLLTGVAVVEGVRRATGLRCGLKWPNDVLLDDKKVAGILVERVESASAAFAVIGVGINVSTRRPELPVDAATSLLLAGGVEIDRATLLGHVLDAFGEQYDGWRARDGAPEALRASYLEVCDTVGREVRVELPNGDTAMGEARGIDADGRLLVATAASGTLALGAGDVIHVRARP